MTAAGIVACEQNRGALTAPWPATAILTSQSSWQQILSSEHKLVSPISILDHHFTEDSLYIRLASGCSAGVLVEVSICRKRRQWGNHSDVAHICFALPDVC